MHHLNWKVIGFFFFSITTSVTSKPKAENSPNSVKLDSYEFALSSSTHTFSSESNFTVYGRDQEARKGLSTDLLPHFFPTSKTLSDCFLSSNSVFFITEFPSYFLLCSVPPALCDLL